ncbi:MAG TPA: cysteine desulfurase [Planktothrix sp.]|jgi:cysteine desulfurase/selenocysteine lyase
MLNVKEIREDFPILKRQIAGKPLVYLDNAATSQKPTAVIQAISDYYLNYNANVHRGIHTLSEEATEAYEGVREKIRKFINASSTREIIFTRNTTEALNLLAHSWGRQHVLPGDEIVLTGMEHHSNFVPWQQLAQEREAKLVFLEQTPEGLIDLEAAKRQITDRTRIVAITQMSNVLGVITPVKELTEIAHKHGAIVIVDGAQGVPHLVTDVQKLGCDFLTFSFHKMLGPTGVGVLWGKEALLEAMPPFMTGGDMISSVAREKTAWNELPWKFEAGTPNIADVIGSGAAIDYLNKIGMHNVREHEIEITKYALKKLQEVPTIEIYGPKDAEHRGGVIAFNFSDVHPHDVGQILNDSGVAIRAGHHCCQPLMRDLNVPGTARASFYIYNTPEEVDALIAALKDAHRMMGHVALR